MLHDPSLNADRLCRECLSDHSSPATHVNGRLAHRPHPLPSCLLTKYWSIRIRPGNRKSRKRWTASIVFALPFTRSEEYCFPSDSFINCKLLDERPQFEAAVYLRQPPYQAVHRFISQLCEETRRNNVADGGILDFKLADHSKKFDIPVSVTIFSSCPMCY